MSDRPEVRALTSHVALQHVEGLAAPVRAAILDAVGDVAAVRDAYAFSWVPLRTQVAILDAMRASLAPTEWLASQRALMTGYLAKPVLRVLFDSAVRIFGLSVETLVKWTPRAYDALFRNAGVFRVEPGMTRGAAELHLVAFPPDLFRSSSFVEAMACSLEVIFTLAHTEGTVAIVDWDAGSGSARYAMRWAGPQ